MIAEEFNRLLLDPDVVEQEEQTYLRSLGDQKRVPYSRDEESADVIRTHPEELHLLRRALVRVASKAGAIFGAAMAESVEAVSDEVPPRVRPRRKDKEFNELREILILACAKAHHLKTHRPGELSELFATQGVYDRMIELAEHLTRGWVHPDTRRRLRSRRDEQDDIRAVLNGVAPDDSSTDADQEPDPPHLHLYQLEWIADLLWYTFRFDAAVYPTNAELAFQISLEVQQSDQRPDLGAAVEVRGPLDASRLREWFRSYRPSRDHEENELLTKFYDSLARLLHAQYRASRDPQSPRDPVESVAFSTNFDLELEDALMRDSSTSIHVAVPVLVHTRTEPTETHLRWLLGTTRAGTSVDKPAWQWFPEDSHSLPADVGGPLIVKLDGSPLHMLPAVDDLDGGSEYYRQIEHALTASESEHLLHIILLDTAPDFFKSVLRDQQRKFFLLGQSISDWVVKLRLFDLVYPARMNPPAPREIIAINERFDPYRSSVLDALGVDRWRGRVEDLTELINEEFPG